MNIFRLHDDPEIAAAMHCDKHVVKMILETAQLLSSAHWMSDSSAPYRLTHKNHPSSKWTRQSIQHYRWLIDLGLHLCEEYTYRYDKIHKTQSIIEWLSANEPNIPDDGFVHPPQCMPDYCKLDDTVLAYRNYYISEKSKFAKWKTTIPGWYQYAISA